jgi:hypothetical protein
MTRKLHSFIILISVLPSALFAQVRDTTAERYANMVNAALLKQHLSVIASDAYEGRETGRKGQKMAADYIRAEFKKLGLKPGNDTSFFQNYPLVVRKSANIDFSVAGTPYVFRKDFYTFSQPEFHDQVFEGSQVIFKGFGIHDSLTGYNDYKKGPDAKGKIALVYKGEPKDKKGKYIISHAGDPAKPIQAISNKIDAARNAGVRVLLIVSSDDPANQKQGRASGERIRMAPENTGKPEMIVLYISKDMADKIMGADLEALSKKEEEKGKPQSLVKKTNVKIDVHRDEPGYSGENVIGILEGSTRKNEYVFITAHYDHLGIINGQVYNGADDDGSGTVSVLSLARAYVKAKEEGHGPERNIVFMTVSGEEKGLLGSAWYVEHPTIPLSKIVCDLNIDMIGRIDDAHKADPAYVYVIGSDKLSSALHSINETANATYTHLKLDYTYNDTNDPNRFYYRSDHYNFAKNDIPVIFYFNGTHADYHQETDEVDKIDFNMMEKRARLVFYTAWVLSNRPDRIVVDSHKK